MRYQDWRERTPLTELKPATFAVVEGRLVGFKERPMRGMRWRRLATGWLEGAGGGRIRVVWFNLPAYMKGRMPDGERVVMHGRVGDAPDGGIGDRSSEVYPLDSGEPPAMRPVYGLPAEIGQRVYAGLVAQALAALGGRIEGAMPAELRAQAGVMALGEALRMLHQPPPTLIRRSSKPAIAPRISRSPSMSCSPLSSRWESIGCARRGASARGWTLRPS